MRALTENLSRHLASEETVQNVWCLVYSSAIVAVYVFALNHLM